MTKQKVTLAQISDVHLPFPNWPPLDMWNTKRALGLLNWHRGRRFVHRFEAVNLLLADMKSHMPDHIAVTGDLVNLGLPQEYRAAHDWLQTLGSPDKVSVIPGNHDIYCRSEISDDCRSHWAAYMQSDAFGRSSGLTKVSQFPFMRRIGPLALLGINSAHPTPPFIAQGRIGDDQRTRLKKAARFATAQGLFVCVMVHHPPLPGLSPDRRALVDAEKMITLIETCPVGLVLYGHNHLDATTWVKNDEHQGGKVAVCGAASGSAYRRHKKEPLARYYLYTFTQEGRDMTVERTTRGLNEPGGGVVEIDRTMLLPVEHHGCAN